jgi:hypothetical protein
VQKYVSRRKETSKKYRRRNTFGMGQDGEQWQIILSGIH